MRRHEMQWAAFALLLAATGCQSGKNPQKDNASADTAEMVTTEQQTESRSLQWENFTVNAKAPGDFKVSYLLNMPFPTNGPKEQVEFLRKSICELVDTKIKSYNREGLQKAAQNFVDEHLAEVKDLMEEGDDPSSPYLTVTYDATLDVTTSNEKYITIHQNGYLFTGGAHGMPFNSNTTFDLQRLKKLGWEDFFVPGAEAQLTPIIKKGIVEQYYKPEGFDGPAMKFALPSLPPALTAEGVNFQYAAYEIDCYAAGMPACTIPFEDLLPWLTPELKELIGK